MVGARCESAAAIAGGSLTPWLAAGASGLPVPAILVYIPASLISASHNRGQQGQ